MNGLRASLFAALIGSSGTVDAQTPPIRYKLDIPRQTLTMALADFARETGLQVARFSDLNEHSTISNAVVGTYTAEQAIDLLLAGSEYRFRFVNPHTIAIIRAPRGEPGPSAKPAEPSRDPLSRDSTKNPKNTKSDNANPRGEKIMRNRGMMARLIALLTVCSAVHPGGVCAQNAASDQTAQLEEVVVTAQRRSQNLQKVPVSVSALSENDLEMAGIASGNDLGKAVPSLEINHGTGAALIFLRGIGNSVSSAGNEASTAVYVDGIYYARVAPSFLEFNNVDRIEVLKGPQGTLFGRNATGGLIQVVTRTPTAEPVLRVSVGYENYQRIVTKAYAAGGLSEHVAADVAVIYNDQREGWGRNVTTGSEAYRDRNLGVRAKLVADASDLTRVTLIGEYGNSHGDIGLTSQPYQGTTQGATPGMPPHVYLPLPGFYDVRNGIDDLQVDQSYGGSLKIEQEFSFAKLVSLSAYRHSYIDQKSYDVDFVPDDYFHAVLNERAVQFSQELQLLSKEGSSFDWIAGAFYLDTQDGYRPGSILGGRQFGGAELRFQSKQSIKSLAGYAQSTFPIAKDTHLTTGVRYTRDKVGIAGTLDVALPGGPVLGPVAPPVDDSTNFNKTTWKFALDHTFTPDILGFVSISRGFKAGTYVTLPAANVVARPEVLDAYEIGLKTELFDRRLRLNGAVFFYNLKDPQVEILNGPSVYAINAGGAHVKGLDLDFEFAATENLKLRGGLGLLDAKYTTFTNAPSGLPNSGPNGGNLPETAMDVSGFTMQRAPKFTGSLNAIYTIPMASGSWALSASVSHNSGFYWQPTHHIRQDAYTLLDAQVGYTFPSKHLGVRVYGRNLSNKKYYTAAFESGGQTGFDSAPAAPRTYGLAFDVNF